VLARVRLHGCCLTTLTVFGSRVLVHVATTGAEITYVYHRQYRGRKTERLLKMTLGTLYVDIVAILSAMAMFEAWNRSTLFRQVVKAGATKLKKHLFPTKTKKSVIFDDNRQIAYVEIVLSDGSPKITVPFGYHITDYDQTLTLSSSSGEEDDFEVYVDKDLNANVTRYFGLPSNINRKCIATLCDHPRSDCLSSYPNIDMTGKCDMWNHTMRMLFSEYSQRIEGSCEGNPGSGKEEGSVDSFVTTQ